MGQKISKFNSIAKMEEEKADWVQRTKDLNNFNGIKTTLTKLYTSSGHFIFELLQNAEDVFATSVTFKLEKDKLIFEHNGSRAFDINDIDSITNIGDSTKKDNGNTIGKFGIGFKSVFEYTDTPEIHSGDYHFKIEDLFVPKVIEKPVDFDSKKTLIVLPFNACDKSAEDCFNEINESLRELKSTALLFLQNIAEIICRIENTEIKLTRVNNYSGDNCPKGVCRLHKSENGEIKAKGYFKRFFKEIPLQSENEVRTMKIAVAFKVTKVFNDTEECKWKIKPIFKKDAQKKETNTPNGSVFAYFPCKAEEKKLCFHIHAPFALTVDREKLRDDKANNIVIAEIGNLVCESMKAMKDDGFVDLELYKALPNLTDDKDLGKYDVIQAKIVNYFANNPYVLMADDTYQDAHNKFIGVREIQELLPDADLSMLYKSNQKSYWVKNPMRNMRDYNFLKSIGVKDFDIVVFLEKLLDLRKEDSLYHFIIDEFEKKEISWFTRLYSLMNNALTPISRNENVKHNMQLLRLCYCEDNKLYQFNQCYVSEEKFSNNSSIHFVNTKCLRNNSTGADFSYFFKSSLGVKAYTQSNVIQEKCEEFSRKENKTLEDTIEFFKIYQKDNSVANILKNYAILCAEEDSDIENLWWTPDRFYLPEEFDGKIKNISIYYDFYNTLTSKTRCISNIFKLNPEYKTLLNTESEFNEFKRFLLALGVTDNLKLVPSSCRENPNWEKVISANVPEFVRGKAIETDEDYEVLYLDKFLKGMINEGVFELILSFLMYTNSQVAYCRYTPAAKYKAKSYPSQIAVALKNTAWVLQKIDNEPEYYVKPAEAKDSSIPLIYRKEMESAGQNLKKWLDSIDFGKEEQKQSEQHKAETAFLSNLGLDSEFVEAFDELKKNSKPEDLKSFMEKLTQQLKVKASENLYASNDIDEERVYAKTLENYGSASDIIYEKTSRSIRTSKKNVKDFAEAFLRANCVDDDKRVRCQICNNLMPFKDSEGKDYFEKIQIFKQPLVSKETHLNYIALCPVCAAKMEVFFQHAKDKQEQLYNDIAEKDNTKDFLIKLDKEEWLHFSDIHIFELRAIIKAEKNIDGE